MTTDLALILGLSLGLGLPLIIGVTTGIIFGKRRHAGQMSPDVKKKRSIGDIED